MKKLLTLFVASIFLMSNCELEYDDQIVDIFGIYGGQVVGVGRNFDMTVTAAGGDDIEIEAPFDGKIWDVIRADIDDKDKANLDIDIHRQTLEPGVEIWGDGFFFEGTMQLNYTMQVDGERRSLKLIAKQY